MTHLNNTYFKRGVKRYLEEIATFRYIPDEAERLFMSVIEAKTIEEIRSRSFELLKSILTLYDKMYENFVKQLIPTYGNLYGTYEKLWCNCQNKVIASVVARDKSYAYHVVMGAQNYLDEMTKERGTKKLDIMKYFDADNLEIFRDQFMNIMDEYLEEYHKVGRQVKRYEIFEDLYQHYMNL